MGCGRRELLNPVTVAGLSGRAKGSKILKASKWTVSANTFSNVKTIGILPPRSVALIL